ncbi:MAG: hypothetical protein AAFQ59_18665, partial [Pseudomonadota bacterium]
WKLLIESAAPQYNDRALWGTMLMRQAARIATNRTVAGVHFPVDSVAGQQLGLTLAEHFYSMCNGGSWVSATFNGPNFDATQDFDWHELYDPNGDIQAPEAKAPGPDGKVWGTSKVCTENGIPASPSLAWLWGKALDEWKDFGPVKCE